MDVVKEGGGGVIMWVCSAVGSVRHPMFQTGTKAYRTL